jgi:hypothetical protein
MVLRWEIKQHIDAFLKDKVIFIQKNSSGEILPLFSSNLNSVSRYQTHFLLDEYTKKNLCNSDIFSFEDQKKNSSKSISVLESLLREGWAGPICLKHELNYSDQIGP